MDKLGLAFHPATPAFLAETFGVTLQEPQVEGLPLYRDPRGKRFWGGWGSFYSFVDRDVDTLIAAGDRLARTYGLIEGCFSLPHDRFSARHVNIVLTIPVGMRVEDRLALYERNIKKHIRNTIAQSTLVYRMGELPGDWYELYSSVAAERGRHEYPRAWFDTLAQAYGPDVVVAACRDKEKLAGALMCVRHESYLHLFSIATDPMYRSHRVDSGLYDIAIQLALTEGIRFVDFGLTGSRATSLIAYKKGFGGKERFVATPVFGSPIAKTADLMGRAARAVGRRLPFAQKSRDKRP